MWSTWGSKKQLQSFHSAHMHVSDKGTYGVTIHNVDGIHFWCRRTPNKPKAHLTTATTKSAHPQLHSLFNQVRDCLPTSICSLDHQLVTRMASCYKVFRGILQLCWTQSLQVLPLPSLPLWAPCQRSVSRCREPGADPGASWCGWRHQTRFPGTSTAVCWPPLSRQGSTGTWGKNPERWVAENFLKMPSGCFNFHCFILLYTKSGWMKFCNICS